MSILYLSNSRIGDSILGTCILNHLNTAYSDKSITIVATPLTQTLFETVPNLKELYLMSKKPYHWHWIDLIKKFKTQHFEWVIDSRGSLATYALSSKKRSIWKKNMSNQPKVHQLCSWLDIPLTAPKLWLRNADLEEVRRVFESKHVITLAPFANWIGKQWPFFDQLIKYIIAHYPDVKIALCCAKNEEDQLQALLKKFPAHDFIIVCGEANLLKVGAYLSLSDLFIGNDSGLMHLSASVKTPTIGLFGPSNEKIYGPYGFDRYNKSHTIIRTPKSFYDLTNQDGFDYKSKTTYMNDLSLESVIEKVTEILKKTEK